MNLTFYVLHLQKPSLLVAVVDLDGILEGSIHAEIRKLRDITVLLLLSIDSLQTMVIKRMRCCDFKLTVYDYSIRV